MPLFDEYRDQLKSDIADLTNTGGRPAGSITAAMFLKEFTGGLPWVHLDIAGTAWADESEAVSAERAERRRRADARASSRSRSEEWCRSTRSLHPWRQYRSGIMHRPPPKQRSDRDSPTSCLARSG